MSNLIPAEGDNLKLLNKRFSAIKEYIEPYYSSGRPHVVREASGKVMVVSRLDELDTHMHKGWYEMRYHIPFWKLEAYNKES